MKESFDGQRDVWGPVLAHQLKAWSDLVFRPAAVMRSMGLYHPPEIGTRPTPHPRGGGPELSRTYPRLNLLEQDPEDYGRLRQFDLAAAEYRTAVEPYVKVLFDAVEPFLKSHLVDDARIFDAGCGPGREAHLLANSLPNGEVIAADLSREMVKEAGHSGKRMGVENIAYFQMDVGDPSPEFAEYFDLIYCQLSFHFFVDGRGVAEAFRKMLAHGGVAVIADPGPAWFNMLSAPLVALANPAFVKYRTGEEFRELFRRAGFEDVYWTEVLPGMGLTMAAR